MDGLDEIPTIRPLIGIQKTALLITNLYSFHGAGLATVGENTRFMCNFLYNMRIYKLLLLSLLICMSVCMGLRAICCSDFMLTKAVKMPSVHTIYYEYSKRLNIFLGPKTTGKN